MEIFYPKVIVMVKPRFRFWKKWKYIKSNGMDLTDNKNEAGIFEGEGLFRTQDNFLFCRFKYEFVV